MCGTERTHSRPLNCKHFPGAGIAGHSVAHAGGDRNNKPAISTRVSKRDDGVAMRAVRRHACAKGVDGGRWEMAT